MTAAVYYLPGIPDNRSDALFNHALGIADAATESLLVTYPDAPPAALEARYDDVEVVTASIPMWRACQAKRAAERFAAAARDRTVYVTSFHHAPAFSGFLSSLPWVVDVYDDPNQYHYDAPRSVYRLTTPLLTRLLSRADRGIYTVFPSTPHVFHDEPRFAINGAAIDALAPRTPPADPLRAVVAGTKASVDVHIRAVARLDRPVALEVFGDIPPEHRCLAERLGVADTTTFHGRVDAATVQRCVERSHVGFCLLPDRLDWQYAYPLRVGEYLAGGTVPITTDTLPIRDLTRGVGLYVDLTPAAVADALRDLLDTPERREALQERARKRAEKIPWHEERAWFAAQALGTE